MDWTQYGPLAEEWTTKTGEYVRAINEFVATGMAEGFDRAGEQPVDPRDTSLGQKVAAVVREANELGDWRSLRERFPPAQAPFVALLEEKAVGIRHVRFLDEQRVVATVGSPWRPEAALVFGFDGEVEHASDGAIDVGISPDRRHVALLHDDHVRVLVGWGGSEVGRFPRPRGDEGADVEGVETLEGDDGPAAVEQMVVMPGGRAVALATSRGVFLTTDTGARRLSPDREQLAESVKAWDVDEPFPLRTDMTHVAVNPEGTLIACGCQDSQHELRRPDGTLVGAFGPLHSEYPHHAAFSPDGTKAIFNSCHFYNGVTSIGRVEELVGLHLDAYEEDIRLLPLQYGARVYDSAFHDGAYLLGDANGYVRAVKPSGDFAWQHFIGSSVGGVDVSPSGERLAVGTAAGFLALLERDAEPDPYRIGHGTPFRERIRYVRWEGEKLWRW